jgi:molybdate transport system substrate-binding protein
MPSLTILGGGAAQGLVASLAPRLLEATGFNVTGEFGAVGVIADKLRQGQPADLVILTAALVARLADEKLVAASSIADVGLVETALAVRAGDPEVLVKDADDLRRALLAADAIFVPDTKTSTAGIHVAKVLEQLGIATEVGGRLRIYPNGATAMRHLAGSNAKRPVGCTQSTEIISTEGVVLSGVLPRGCDLATMYTAGIMAHEAHPQQARALIDLLISPGRREMRMAAGFLDRGR